MNLSEYTIDCALASKAWLEYITWPGSRFFDRENRAVGNVFSKFLPAPGACRAKGEKAFIKRFSVEPVFRFEFKPAHWE